jgi:hypothetical protein
VHSEPRRASVEEAHQGTHHQPIRLEVSIICNLQYLVYGDLPSAQAQSAAQLAVDRSAK